MEDSDHTHQIVPQQSAPLPPQAPQVVHHVHHAAPTRDPGLAVILEILPGFMMQTFGIGNIYAGNVTGGILMMIGYWVLLVINVFLCFLLIGLLTLPATWIVFMVLCPMSASSAAKRRNAGY